MTNGNWFTRCGAFFSSLWRSARGLVDEADLALLEIAESAVDQLGGLRRGAAREIAPLHESGPEAPGGGIEEHAGPCDPAADDEHVESFVSEARQGIGAIEAAAQRGGP